MKVCIVCNSDQPKGQWYTGPLCKPCYRKGHRQSNIDEYKQRDASYYEEKREHILAREKAKYEENPEPKKARTRAMWVKTKNDPELLAEANKQTSKRMKKWYHEDDKGVTYYTKYRNNNRAKVRKLNSNQQKKHPSRYAFHTAKRRAQKVQATPPWLTIGQLREIRAIYSEAARLTRETGIKHEVDHIHPLLGKIFCGLHVPWNLQILTKEENCKKNNKLYKS